MTPQPRYTIDRIELENFRRFAGLDVTFERDLTVLVSRNSGGKSAVLDAVARLLAPWVTEFGPSAPGFVRDDVRVDADPNPFVRVQAPPVLPMRARAVGDFGGELSWSTAIQKLGERAKPTTVDTRPLRKRAVALRNQMAHDVPVTGPVLAYYGTSRLWKDDSTRASSSGPLVRSDAYDRCLTSHSAFKQLAFWMQKESAADLQLAERGESHRSNALQAVTAVCDTVLSPSLWGQVRYDWRLGTITAEHPTLGLMPVRQLSDGVRSMLALAADVAFRCFLLNPHLGANAASESPGIVLIDEIDLHLHPEWQFEVLPCLRNAFPRVQFIVSTHSPQVLASIEGRCLRNLEETATNSGSCGVAVAGRLDVTTLGRPSYSLMEELQGVKPRPQNAVTERLSRYLQLVRTTSSESAEARVLRKELERDLGPEDPALNQARVRLQVPPGD